MTATFQLVIDCADPEPLARFWVAALGYEFEPPPDGYDDWDDYWRAVGVSEDELGLGLDPHHRSGREGPADLVPGGPGEEDAQEPAAPRHHRQRRASDSDRDQAPARGRRGAAAGSARHRGIRAGQEHGRCGHHIPAGAAGRAVRAARPGLPGLARSGGSDRPAGSGLLQDLTAVAVTCRQAGIGLFVLACFAGHAGEAQRVREAAGVPLKAARLAVPPAGIGQRLTSDVTSGRPEGRDEAAASVAAREGASLDDVVIRNDRPIRGRRPGTDDVPRTALARRPPCRTSGQAAAAAEPGALNRRPGT